MKTGIFVTEEEAEHVRVQYSVSGMFLSGGRPMGDPGAAVQELVDKYDPPAGAGLNLKTREFETPN